MSLHAPRLIGQTSAMVVTMRLMKLHFPDKPADTVKDRCQQRRQVLPTFRRHEPVSLGQGEIIMNRKTFRIAIALVVGGISLLTAARPSEARIIVDPVRCTGGRLCTCRGAVRGTVLVYPQYCPPSTTRTGQA
jgi:hypothetical protein